MIESSPAPAESGIRTGLWARPLEAARENWKPGLFLQAFALAVALAYYFHGPTQAVLDNVADLKQRTGYLYSFFATALFGGLIPFLYLRAHPATRPHTPLSHGVFLMLVWAVKGVEVDALYRFQGYFWGNGTDVATIACKVVTDLFGFAPLYATPSILLLFYWKENGFSFAAMRRLDIPGFMRRNLLTALVATWTVWLPAVAIIYSLPPALQVPLFNIVLCFFSLFLATLTRLRRG